jgi:hypothetical protein
MTQAREHQRPAADKQPRQGKARDAGVAGSGQFVRVHTDDDVTEVPVSKVRYGRIANKRAALSKVIANYADTAAKAKRTGKVFVVTYRVSPNGKIEVVREAPADKPAASPLDAAIARAKGRGATKVADILKSADMLTARDFGPLIDASHETVNAKRKRHEVLGLQGSKRGLRYPRWQVTADGRELPGLPQVFEVLGDQPWTVFRFLRASHPELGGQTALDALKGGKVEAVVDAAKNQAGGAFS